MEDISYKDLESFYNKHFSLGHLNTDINTKFALISLICYITEKLKKKVPDVTYYQIIYKLSKGIIPEENVKSLAIMCNDFAYGCSEFPTFNIPDKEIPSKIREIMSSWTPF